MGSIDLGRQLQKSIGQNREAGMEGQGSAVPGEPVGNDSRRSEDFGNTVIQDDI